MFERNELYKVYKETAKLLLLDSLIYGLYKLLILAFIIRYSSQ